MALRIQEPARIQANGTSHITLAHALQSLLLVLVERRNSEAWIDSALHHANAAWRRDEAAYRLRALVAGA